MKKITKKLALTTQTIRSLQAEDLSQVQGGSVSVYNPSGGSVMSPTTSVQTPSTVIHLPSTSVIRGH